MSLFQYPSQESQGQNRREHRIFEEPNTVKNLMELPESYTTVSPLVLTKKDAPIPSADAPFNDDCHASTEQGTKRLGKFLYITIDSFLIMILHY